jgi:hypothetical protein
MKKKSPKPDECISLLETTGKEPLLDPSGKVVVDENVQMPEQVRRAAELAEALVTGKPLARVPQRNETFPYSDAEIGEVLRSIGGLQAKDARLATIIALAREGARHIQARRRGARQPREKSDNVTRRLQALIQAYRELSPNLQKRPTGVRTINSLRNSIIQKLGLQDDDDVISEDTIRQDIRQVRLLLRLVEKGLIPRTGKPSRQGISEKTRQEMEAGRRASERAAINKTTQIRPNRDTKPQHKKFEK